MSEGKLSVGKAFLLQAKEDLHATETLGHDISLSPSTFCMLLQMVFEKLAKAYRHRHTYSIPSQLRHEIAGAHFNKTIDEIIRKNPQKHKYYKRIMGLIRTLEDAQPAIAKRKSVHEPQLEYPWENEKHEICYPAKDFPFVQRLLAHTDDIRTAWEALKFAKAYINELDASIRS